MATANNKYYVHHGSVWPIVLHSSRFSSLPCGERRRIIARAIARLDGLDVLEEFLGDPEVDEVMVNGGREVWVERRGVVERVDELPDGAIDVVLERVLAPLGRRLDRKLLAHRKPFRVGQPCHRGFILLSMDSAETAETQVDRSAVRHSLRLS